jgi:hypothetical protein
VGHDLGAGARSRRRRSADVARQEGPGRFPAPRRDPIVQIAAVDGKLVATYHAEYEVQALAITTRYVFVDESRTIIDPAKGGTAILSAATGKLLHWLPGKGGANMSASGRYAVFSSLYKVFLLDGATGGSRRSPAFAA